VLNAIPTYLERWGSCRHIPHGHAARERCVNEMSSLILSVALLLLLRIRLGSCCVGYGRNIALQYNFQGAGEPSDLAGEHVLGEIHTIHLAAEAAKRYQLLLVVPFEVLEELAPRLRSRDRLS
jgi:hypothetical protein